MLYTCPTPACVEVVRERARMIKQAESTPNREPDTSVQIAKHAIDHALGCLGEIGCPSDCATVRQDMIRAAALMIEAIERFDHETQVVQPEPVGA